MPRNPPSCFLISCFTISLTPPINTPEFSSDFMILISTPSFRMTKQVPFPALITPALLATITPIPQTFLWIAPSITHADAIVANAGKKCSTKGKPTLSMDHLIYQTAHQEILFWFFALMLEIIHEAILHCESFSYLY